MTDRLASAAHGRDKSLAAVVTRLTATNALGLVSGLVAGPITARTLGAQGRGELAAIMSVLVIVPWVLDLGLSQWLARERAQGRDRSDLLGAALPLALACSLLGVLAAVPLSHALGRDRSTVVLFLQIGLFSAPVTVLLQTLVGLAMGESRWGLYSAARATTAALPTLAIVVLALLDELTVTTAAIAYLASGLLGTLLFLRLLSGIGRLRLDLTRMRAAASFGAKSWLALIGTVTNARVDQILMAALVSSRELGLYAVAVACTAITGNLIGAVTTAVFPRVARGDRKLAARACRVTILGVGCLAAGVAAIVPTVVPFAFGREFEGAVVMTVILLAASVPLAAGSVIGSALSAAGNPAATMRAELAALAVTLPGLVLLLPGSGGRGAAVVSVAAYTLRLVIQLRSAGRTFELPWSAFVFASAEDLRWLRARLGVAVTSENTRPMRFASKK